MKLIESRGSSNPGGRPASGSRQSLTVTLGAFGWRAIEEQAAELGVSAEELARHALLYYLADRDSGRIARARPATYPRHATRRAQGAASRVVSSPQSALRPR
jgi:hypothetical protein